MNILNLCHLVVANMSCHTWEPCLMSLLVSRQVRHIGILEGIRYLDWLDLAQEWVIKQSFPVEAALLWALAVTCFPGLCGTRKIA